MESVSFLKLLKLSSPTRCAIQQPKPEKEEEEEEEEESFINLEVVSVSAMDKTGEKVRLKEAKSENHLQRLEYCISKRKILPMEASSTQSQNSSKRLLVQKTLKLIKPLYEKVVVMKKYCREREKHENENVSIGGLRGNKHFGKSKSARVLPCNRRDDSLQQQQQDWIQGAILHCKRSLNASSEHSMLISSEIEPTHQRP